MSITIDDLGGTSEVARLARVAPPSVTAWRKRGIPPERCPDIERGLAGKFVCEQICPDTRWVRVPDPDWPHPKGRPCIDVAGPASECQHAA
ncbi:YdaS family helix-turn-helix protein [Roseateles sp. DC23W]|uniref:YdaS family helix-turn-helix protein n=1 Tax=Pelomonas dachongensis TaxID=3299029 RepID=A0ABW7EK51_9BURK